MTKFPTVRALRLTLTIAAALAAAAPALAQTDEAPIIVTVSYADLDISHAAGAKIMNKRIEAASVRSCGGAPDDRLLRERAAFDKCHNRAFNEAVIKFNALRVSAIAGQAQHPVNLASR